MTIAACKEHPILFSGEMVRAILDGRKTQTRRVVKPQPMGVPLSGIYCYWLDGPGRRFGFCNEFDDWVSPYGGPGDRLWVRECWAVHPSLNEVKPCDIGHGHRVWYRATEQSIAPQNSRWRPSIHMPRWASRITLEVTGVRVERVQQISDADVIAEDNPWVWIVEFQR